jgi:hypothetical protein
MLSLIPSVFNNIFSVSFIGIVEKISLFLTYELHAYIYKKQIAGYSMLTTKLYTKKHSYIVLKQLWPEI